MCQACHCMERAFFVIGMVCPAAFGAAEPAKVDVAPKTAEQLLEGVAIRRVSVP